MSPAAHRLILARGLRGFADGVVSVLLASYLTRLGFTAVEVGAIVTATVDARRCEGDTADALALAEAAVEGLATSSRLVLRRAWRCQATTFLAGLPLGILLPQHLRVPAEFKDLL